MPCLILGLLVFLGMHSVRVVADGWRTQALSKVGLPAYKGAYSLVSLLGLGLIVYGFGQARETPQMLWMPPEGMRHATAAFTLIAFILFAAAYVPGNSIKARFHHPMVLGVKSWALGHLLANGSVAHVLLFGSFLLWGVASFIAARRRDRVSGADYPAGTVQGTVLTVLIGAAGWAVFAFWLHGLLMGIRPFG